MLRPSSTPPAVSRDHELVARRLVLGLAVGACRRPRRRTCGPCGRRPSPRRRARSARRCSSRARRPRRARRSSRRRGRCRARARSRVAQRRAGPSNGSAPAAVSSGVPSTAHFSGSTTSSAPAAAAARVSRSAVARLRSRSAVEVSWTAAARTVVLPSPRIDSSVNPRRSISSGHGGARERVARSGPGAAARCRCRRRACPRWRGGRPLKRWTWVGAFGPELMLCAAVARIGPATAAWWAVWDRATELRASARCGARAASW